MVTKILNKVEQKCTKIVLKLRNEYRANNYFIKSTLYKKTELKYYS